MSPLSFELIELAIQLLLGCQSDAESFLSADHSVVGEIEDTLAQAYAALGNGLCLHLPLRGISLPCVCSRDLGLVWLGLSVFHLRLLSLPFSFPFPEQVHPQLTVVLG